MQVQALVDHTKDNFIIVENKGLSQDYVYALHHDGQTVVSKPGYAGPGLKTGKKKVVQYSKKAEKLRQEIIARNARKNKGKNLVLIDRNTNQEFRYKTKEQLLSGLKSKYKKWDVSRFKFKGYGEGADMTLKEGKTVTVYVRKMTNGKQKGNLQISSQRENTKREAAMGADPRKDRPISGIFAKPI